MPNVFCNTLSSVMPVVFPCVVPEVCTFLDPADVAPGVDRGDGVLGTGANFPASITADEWELC